MTVASKRGVQACGVVGVLVVALCAAPTRGTAEPSAVAPCIPPTFSGRAPAYLDDALAPSNAVWLDPVVAGGDPFAANFADAGQVLRYTPIPRYFTAPGATLRIHFPSGTDGGSVVFAGRAIAVAMNGSIGSWVVPTDTAGVESGALIGSTRMGRVDTSYAFEIIVPVLGSPVPQGPGPLMTLCGTPPPAVCAAYHGRLVRLAREQSQEERQLRQEQSKRARARTLSALRRTQAMIARQKGLYAGGCP
jgi:hypothetical protein